MAKTFHSKKEQAAYMLISTVSLTKAKLLKNPRWYHSDWLITWSMPLALTDTMVRLRIFSGFYSHANIHGKGPFRRTCEITLSLLRQNEDALMTVLETFLHDPTTDFIGKRVSTFQLRYQTSQLLTNLFTPASHPCECPGHAGWRFGRCSEQTPWLHV